MPPIGAHMSIAGGFHKAVIAAGELGLDCVQIFVRNPRSFPKPETGSQSGRSLTKNNNQWRAKPLSEEDVQKFRAALEEHRIVWPVAHDSYLINLASPDAGLWQKSLDSLLMEL